MKVEDIKKVLIIGSGTMGQQIGGVTALHGYDVVMYDIKQEFLDTAVKRIKSLYNRYEKAGKITAADGEKALSKIIFTTDISVAAKDADFISESVPEDPVLKGKIFAQFNELCPKHTIFSSNTSTLLPSMFAKETGRPEKFVCLHFHDMRVTDIVDVMPHPGTSKETMEVTTEFAIRIGQIPIVMAKESSGYVFNAMLTALFTAAQTLVANGVASVEDVDKSWMGVSHMTNGPFGLMDGVGLDTCYKVTKYWADENNDAQGKKNAEFIKTYVDKGLLGQKTGEGFFKYPNPAYQQFFKKSGK